MSDDRIGNIKKHVSLTDVMRAAGHIPAGANGVDFQLACPFHGKDNKPSAHVYDGERFHCFTCHRAYDVISYFEAVHGVEFKNALYLIEKQYNIPKLKSHSVEKLQIHDKKPTVSVGMHCDVVEKQLIANRKSYGLDKYAKLLFVLDEARRSESAELLEKVKEKM